MRPVRWLMVGGLAAFVAAPQVAAAKGARLIGAKLEKKVKPATGFVDNPVAFDEAGGRLLYVNASVAGRAELRVLDLAQGAAQLAAVDISAFTVAPKEVAFVLDGAHYLVVAETKDGAKAAAVVGAKGVVRTFGPATDIRRHREGGADQLVLYTRAWVKGKKGPPDVHHSVEILDLSNGRRVGKKRTLVADEMGKVSKLEFTIAYWLDDYTRAVGVKGGKWDRKEDQRTPDRQAIYEMATGTFSKTFPIKDVIEHRRTMKLLGEHQNQRSFVVAANDLTGVLRVDDGVVRPIKLTEAFSHYDHQSLVMQPAGEDGTIFFSLTIDPVHPDAVARRRAVPRYLDLYELAPRATKAKRRARIKLTDKRSRHWVATPEYWAVVPGHIGFDRGGRSLELYKLD